MNSWRRSNEKVYTTCFWFPFAYHLSVDNICVRYLTCTRRIEFSFLFVFFFNSCIILIALQSPHLFLFGAGVFGRKEVNWRAWFINNIVWQVVPSLLWKLKFYIVRSDKLMHKTIPWSCQAMGYQSNFQTLLTFTNDIYCNTLDLLPVTISAFSVYFFL